MLYAEYIIISPVSDSRRTSHKFLRYQFTTQKRKFHTAYTKIWYLLLLL